MQRIGKRHPAVGDRARGVNPQTQARTAARRRWAGPAASGANRVAPACGVSSTQLPSAPRRPREPEHEPPPLRGLRMALMRAERFEVAIEVARRCGGTRPHPKTVWTNPAARSPVRGCGARARPAGPRSIPAKRIISARHAIARGNDAVRLIQRAWTANGAVAHRRVNAPDLYALLRNAREKPQPECPTY